MQQQQPSNKITIIGIGDDGFEGLTRQALELIRTAGTVLGPANLLSKLAPGNYATVPLPADLEAAVESVAQAKSGPLVLLASGDPLFYGVARYLCDRLGKERFEVVPHVSSMQLAFARVKESWDEAYLTNLASQSLSHAVSRIRMAQKVGLFTTPQATPAHVARALIDQHVDYFTAYVCENLGSPDERVTRGSLVDIARQKFSDLNVMVLVRQPDVPDRPTKLQGKRLFGNPDECFLQSRPKRGLLTQAEVRSIALSQMDLGISSVVWDVGAGSGSVAIEAAQLASAGQVFAIEMDPEDYNLLVENSRTFGTMNLTPVLGEAPSAWADLPDPNAIFIGGTGRAVTGLIEAAWTRLRNTGRLVVHVSSLDSLSSAEAAICALGQVPDILMINLARSQVQMDTLRFEAVSPTFLLTACKP
ncbi:MAG: precorrin-6y C5,15-methyltransferase (decarboxylating) subunit CbiE [Pirellulaceae bacterium]|nr:precorrin-6y C5,15-methyltransferase (decarboxylating) subunit CbiE [Pirellulaceae bacterium]